MHTAPEHLPTIAEMLDGYRKLALVSRLAAERGQMGPERALASFDKAEAELVNYIRTRCVADPVHGEANWQRYEADVLPILLAIRAETLPVFEKYAAIARSGSFA